MENHHIYVCFIYFIENVDIVMQIVLYCVVVNDRYFCVSIFFLQCVCVEQLTLDFEYLINEVIRNDAEWASQFCSFSDYDVVILEVSVCV